jgi:hypothetical protein
MDTFNGLLNKAFIKAVRKPAHNILRIQERTLLRMLGESARTFIGKEYGFPQINSLSEYQERVPVHHFEDMEKYWQAEAEGVVGASVGKKIPYFALTAGTTGDKKLVPVSQHVLECNRKSELYLMTLFLTQHPDSGVLRKRILGISGSASIEKTPSGIPCGMVSGIMAETLPALFKPFFLPDRCTVNMEDWDRKLGAYTEGCRGKKIGAVAAIPTALIDVFKRIKSVFSSKDFREFAGHIDVLCLTGVNYRPYKKAIESILEKDVVFIEYYAASEGILGHQSLGDPDAMEFYYNHVFFEFIPFEEYSRADYHHRLLITELKSDESYVPLITTGNGAFSYVIGDVIKCMDNHAPTFKIEGRTKLTLNLATEKTPVIALEKALEQVSDEVGVWPGEFFVTAGMTDSRPHYLWVIQENAVWESRDQDPLCRRLDEYIGEYNDHYTHFVNNTLGPSQIVFVKKERFENWHSHRKADMGHRKIPRVMENPDYVRMFLD